MLGEAAPAGNIVGRLAIFVIALLAISGNPAVGQTAPDSNPPESRTYVGPAVCDDCHQTAIDNFAHSIHGELFLKRPRNDSEALGCEACHGPASLHVEDPARADGIIRFTHGSATPVAKMNAQCLGCHGGGEHINWQSSVHESEDLACSDCHNPMATLSARGLLARETVNDTCFSCHREQRSEFRRRSHMPLLEGKISCTDCHNPHGGLSEPMLRTTSVNETCFTCHAEKRGPFLFEHAPVTESCLNCHAPHGSNHEKLLITARPVLCQQCHTMIGHMNDPLVRAQLASGAFPDARLIGRSCQNCHVAIHGSNHPSGAKFHR